MVRHLAVSALIALALLLSGLAGCKKKPENKPGTSAEPTASESTSAVGRPPQRPTTNPSPQGRSGRPRRAILVALTPQEVRESLPTIAGAEFLSEPASSGPGRQVKAEICVPGGLEKTAETVVAALKQAGWSNLHHRPHAKIPNRIGLSGQKAPLRVTGALQSTKNPRCNEIDDKTQVSLTFHKLLSPEQAKAAASE